MIYSIYDALSASTLPSAYGPADMARFIECLIGPYALQSLAHTTPRRLSIADDGIASGTALAYKEAFTPYTFIIYYAASASQRAFHGERCKHIMFE